jgi:hypothetical protein
MPAYLVGLEARVQLSPEGMAKLSAGDGENRYMFSFPLWPVFFVALIGGGLAGVYGGNGKQQKDVSSVCAESIGQ